MRPAEFSEDRILEAGKKLDASGKRVTGYALRRALGGGDQKRLYTVWRNQNGHGDVEPASSSELPVEMEDALQQLIEEFGSQIRKIADRLNTHAVKSAERQVAEVTREYQELKEQSEAEQKDASSIISELEEQLRNQTERFDAMREHAEREHAKAIKLEAQISEMANAEKIFERISALEAKLAR
ncbi:plasmid replication DNA-binding protein KfrA [Marinobacter sp. 3-2]|jgi:vacuolar-type H+-ATPase subunit I/STV1|uniref:DNA-binding protein n=1 Tax=Marinobacter sp. 3-2 TaxID=2485141 RepID=UPI000D3C7EAD|nr:DNA-binding protein [Marinobacter sp. 3-2]ROQ48435.1 plasmid replication DNA-binding protein KfrA [Marinobacter sp. 3-2]